MSLKTLTDKINAEEHEEGIKKLQERINEIVKDFHGHTKFLEIVGDIVELHSEKNRQYAGKEDPLGNFRRGSNIIYKLLNPSFRDDEYRKQISYALILTSKQIDGAAEIIGETKENTFDSLYEKLRDCMVYFGIMMAIESMRIEFMKEKKWLIESAEKIAKTDCGCGCQGNAKTSIRKKISASDQDDDMA